MKYSIVAALFASAALAAPTTIKRRGIYDASNRPVIFTDATCSLSKSLTPGEPFSNAYPTALALGTIVTPLLDAALGKQVVEDIDTVADDLCINAEESDGEGNGICQDALQAIDDFVLAVDPTGQAAKYQCLLNLLCVAHAGVPYNSLCTYLLAGQDCIANRIIGVSNLECES